MSPPEEAGASGRPRIPSVSDLVAAVARETGTAPDRRPEIVHAAQQVCAEELRMARTGFAPAPLSELTARVIRLLPADLGGNRYPGWSWDDDPPFPEEPLEAAPVLRYSPGDPFGGEEDALAAEDAGFSTYPDAVMPEPEAAPEPAEEEPEPDVELAAAENRPSASGGKLAAFLLVAAIAGGVWFFARGKKAAPDGATAPAPLETTRPETPRTGAETPAASAESAPRRSSPPVPPASPTPAAESRPAAPAPPPPAIPESRGSSMISPDWAGRAPSYMIHFSSFQKKENADRDAAQRAKALGRSLRVVEVNLGAPGLWYRVMLGEFRTREEADAARAELAAKGTEGLGLVYRVSAP